jgi:trehalose synthase
MIEVELHAQPLERFRSVLQADRIEEAAAFANAIRERWVARTIWNVNSTAAGGGVAELLRVLLPYVRGTGINARWLVIEGSAEFFRITKRLHHALHGSTGDGSDLGPAAHAIFEDTMRINGTEMAGMVRPRDVVILHDPQTAGLARYFIRAGALVVWRCHIGHDQLNPEVDRGWEFLCPYLENVPVFVFSRRAYIPPACDHRRTTIITPSIDPFSAKNQDLDDATVRAILVHVGLVEGPPGDGTPIFTREDGSPGRVDLGSLEGSRRGAARFRQSRQCRCGGTR